ncbi:Ankyrin repeat domain-containing protein 50 [Mycena kentingensis (nom. inval.)]|nr:Ankyrin repeat domain-containing protein 50 [Mycena kentingensis (nom. inval.)]
MFKLFVSENIFSRSSVLLPTFIILAAPNSRLTTELPPELILLIGDLCALPDLNSLSQTCTHLYAILESAVQASLTPELIERNNLVLWAVREEREAFLGKLLAPPLSASPYTTMWHWQSPLHAAAEQGSTDFTRLLLDAADSDNQARMLGCDNDYSWGEYITPLHVAVRAGHIDVVRLLLERGADANTTYVCIHYGEEWTCPALYDAVGAGNKPMVRLLLAHGANVEGRAWDGPVLAHALRLGDLYMMLLLLEEGKANADAEMYLVTWWPRGDARDQLPEPRRASLLYFALALAYPARPTQMMLEKREETMRLLMRFGATRESAMVTVRKFVRELAEAEGKSEIELLALVDALFEVCAT